MSDPHTIVLFFLLYCTTSTPEYGFAHVTGRGTPIRSPIQIIVSAARMVYDKYARLPPYAAVPIIYYMNFVVVATTNTWLRCF